MRTKIRYEEADWSGHVVKVKGFSGVACTLLGWEIEDYVVEITDDETGDVFEDIEDTRTGNVVVRMVGDDRLYAVSLDDCENISEDDYCPECGQIGCMHGK